MKYAKLQENSKLVKETLIKHKDKPQTRINKYLSEQGVLSRRKADQYILDKRIKINDEIAVLGMLVNQDDKVYLDNKLVNETNDQNIYIALNKPKGIVSTSNPKIKDNIIDFMNYPERIFMIGRLDKETSGLILLTNDGDIVNKILRANYEHEKEYIVTVNKPLTKAFIKDIEKGVTIYNPVAKRHQKTAPAKAMKINNYTFNLIITQGLNRQIRRMVSALNYNVVDLKRIRIINIHLNDLKDGYYRYLTKDELLKLNTIINKKIS